MSVNNIESKVEILLKDIIQNLGYELYDVIYVKEGKDYYLRIIIDKASGIDINDCEKVNDAINEILDEADYIKEQYFLEVSSPGIERILRKKEHFEKQIGNKILVKLYKQIENKKEFEGILKQYNDNSGYIEIKLCDDLTEESISEQKIIKIELKNISLAKTVYDWKGMV